MTPLKLLVALSALSAASHALAWDYVLLDTDKAAQNWQVTSQQLGIQTDKPFSVTLRTLHGEALGSTDPWNERVAGVGWQCAHGLGFAGQGSG